MTTNHQLRIATVLVICLLMVVPTTVPAIQAPTMPQSGTTDASAESTPNRGSHKSDHGEDSDAAGSDEGSDSSEDGTDQPDPAEPAEPAEPTEPTEPSDSSDPEPGHVDETPNSGGEIPDPGGQTPGTDPNSSTPAPDAGATPAPSQPDAVPAPEPSDESRDTTGDSGPRDRADKESASGLFITPPTNPSRSLQVQIVATDAVISAPAGSRVSDGIRDATVPIGAQTLVVTEIVQQVPEWVGFAMVAHSLTALLSLAIFIRERRRRHSAEVDAMIDSLTGIPNRKAFDRRLDLEYRRAARYGRSLSVMVMDLDGFKAINDVKGHAAGDEVLREIAQRLDGRMRDTDLVARIGGDEFAVICPETGINELMTIRSQLAEQTTRGVREPVGLNIGVAEFVPGDHDSASILARADESMYRVKRGQRVETLV